MQPLPPNLPCLHPECPSTFKGQHGRTHHIRAMHLNTNHRTINAEHLTAQENEDRHSDDAFQVDGAHSLESPDIESAGPLPNNANNGPPPLSRRIEHPDLNGVFFTLGILGHSRRVSTLYQHFHVIYMAIPCRHARHHLPEKHPNQEIGLPSTAKLNLSLQTFFTVAQRFLPPTSTLSLKYGRNPSMSSIPLRRSKTMRICTPPSTRPSSGMSPGNVW